LLAKLWKKVLLAICIIAILFDITSKFVRRYSLDEELNSVVGKDSLSSIFSDKKDDKDLNKDSTSNKKENSGKNSKEEKDKEKEKSNKELDEENEEEIVNEDVEEEYDEFDEDEYYINFEELLDDYLTEKGF